MGLFQSPNNSAIMGAAPKAHLGVAGGLLALSRTLGQTTGLPLMGAVFSASVLAAAGPALPGEVAAAPAEALVAGLAGTFRVSAAMAGGALLLAAWAWRLDLVRRGRD
jgi:ABC-type thiamin/hydroxymethylpyrimidine transport system permease subunit